MKYITNGERYYTPNIVWYRYQGKPEILNSKCWIRSPYDVFNRKCGLVYKRKYQALEARREMIKAARKVQKKYEKAVF